MLAGHSFNMEMQCSLSLSPPSFLPLSFLFPLSSLSLSLSPSFLPSSLPPSLHYPHKLGQVPLWYLHNHIVQTWLEASCCCLGNRVLEGGKGEGEGQFVCNIGKGVASHLGGKGGAS